MLDLHTHSTCSDGVLTPTALVRLSRRRGVRLLALTDHDTVAGVDEASRACARAGIAFVPGIEVTARYQRFEIHVLGLRVNPRHRALRAFLVRQQTSRLTRARETIRRFQTLGYSVTWRDLLRVSTASIGRPNLARAVLTRRENHAKIKARFGGKLPSVHDFIGAHLVPGSPAYVDKVRPTITEASRVIRAAGGVVILAHPTGLANDSKMIGSLANPWPVLKRLLARGFDGVEVYAQRTTLTTRKRLLALAKEHHLAVTGGSDFHGPLSDVPLGHYTPTRLIPSRAAGAWVKLDASVQAR